MHNLSRKELKKIQKRLKELNFYYGEVDGLYGLMTRNAVISFKRNAGLRPRYYIGPLTKAALFEGRTEPLDTVITSSVVESPEYMRIAMSYLGLREYKGSRHNPKILEWWIKLGLPFRDDETPWCAGFACGVLEEAGIRSPRSAAARSFNWQQWGDVYDEPFVGAVVSLWRGKPKGWSGHVGFVVGKDQHGNLMILGGNQGNQVSIRPFNPNRVLSYHAPAGTETGHRGFKALPVVTSNGRVSTNEA